MYYLSKVRYDSRETAYRMATVLKAIMVKTEVEVLFIRGAYRLMILAEDRE